MQNDACKMSYSAPILVKLLEKCALNVKFSVQKLQKEKVGQQFRVFDKKKIIILFGISRQNVAKFCIFAIFFFFKNLNEVL